MELPVVPHGGVLVKGSPGTVSAGVVGALVVVRRAQMRWDYVAANNGMGFHSPQEAGRILSSAVDLAHQARVAALKQGDDEMKR
ncbi:MAG TPA: ammonia-forming cytochrome c nitrite reductase subunit c552 [Planctomycetota bacterium]|nr:ammonia-forming cytochrome c nitrite reductase subunit c552 [Planctomycetota bacterium]